jgi:plastocyanin
MHDLRSLLRQRGRVAAGALALLLFGVTRVVGPSAPPALGQPAPCQFVLGFLALQDLIGPQTVGECLEDQHFAANGNAEQRTTGGLLVWRKADNWTAFTDGHQTWLNGPLGLQRRLNATRFAWEGDAVAMQGNRFLPFERTVPAGASLTWVSLDREDHDVVASDLSFESPLIPPGGAWTRAFTEPGRFPYVCDLHAGMEGVVVVTAPAG